MPRQTNGANLKKKKEEETMSSYNPFVVRRAYSPAQVKEIFGPGSDAKKAQKLKTENPQLYKQVRALAVQDGLLAPEPRNPWLGREKPNEHLSDETLRAMSQFSREECVALFVSKANAPGTLNATKLKESDPAKYAALRLAATGYGIIEPTLVEVIDHRTTHHVPAQKPAEDSSFTLSDDLADTSGLPRGTVLESSERLIFIAELISERRAKAAEAREAERLEALRASEAEAVAAGGGE